MTSNARTVVDFLQTHGGALCVPCLIAGVALERWDLLKVIRELIFEGLVLCLLGDCVVCRTETLITRIRPPRRI